MDQSITFSMARIKLRIRHLQELDKLTATQHMVLKLIRDRIAQKLTAYREDTRTGATLLCDHTRRCIDLMARQQEDCAKMKAGHRQEKILLEQVLGTLG